MKTFLMVAAAATLACASVPVSSFAQDVPPPPSEGPDRDAYRSERPPAETGGWPLARREEWLEVRIEHAADRGWLSGNEIQRGQGELAAIRAEQRRLVERDGGALSPTDRGYLVQRIDELNRTLRWQGENPPPPWG